MKIKRPHILFFVFFILTNQIFSQNYEKIYINQDIQLIHLVDSIFIHQSLEESEKYGRFSSNGMLIVKNGKAILIDTPMNNEKTKQIHRFVKDSMDVEIQKLIIGHFHDDCLGGLGFIQSKGIESIANKRTIKKCKELGLPIPSKGFNKKLQFKFEGLTIECRYFGGGHTADNITVWLPKQNILFGGCLIKSARSKGLGNLSDAIVEDWDTSVQSIIDEYPQIKYVIPGHGRFGDKKLLIHTIDLVKKYQKEN